MAYYSFKVLSSNEVIIPEHALAIGEGIDVFSKVVDDLPKFLTLLHEHEVKVLEYHQLDNLKSIQPNLGSLTGTTSPVAVISAGEQYPPKTEE